MNQRKNYLLLSLCLTITFLVKGQNCSTLADVRLAAEVEFLACVTPFGQGDFEDAAELICEQASDGSWLNNADYCNTSDDDWKDHLKNLVELCEIYADGSTFSVMLNCGGNNITITQNDLEDAILDGLTFWYQFHNNAIANNLCPGSDPGECECANTYPCTDNWFDNWIGKQEYLQKIGILFLDVLSQAQYQGLLNNIINDLPDNIQDCNSNRSFTGANLTDVASSMITRGLLACDAVLVREGVVAMQSALDFAPYPQKEGIQQDFSIHQHGHCCIMVAMELVCLKLPLYGEQ